MTDIVRLWEMGNLFMKIGVSGEISRECSGGPMNFDSAVKSLRLLGFVVAVLKWLSDRHAFIVLPNVEHLVTRNGIFRGTTLVCDAYIYSGYFTHRDRMVKLITDHGGIARYSDGMDGAPLYKVEGTLREALWRISTKIGVDGRSPGESAEKLVFFRYSQRMFSVKGTGSGIDIVHACVGVPTSCIVDFNSTAYRIMRANPQFTFCGRNSFTSFSADQLLEIANMVKDDLSPERPKLFYISEAEVEENFTVLLKTLAATQGGYR